MSAQLHQTQSVGAQGGSHVTAMINRHAGEALIEQRKVELEAREAAARKTWGKDGGSPMVAGLEEDAGIEPGMEWVRQARTIKTLCHMCKGRAAAIWCTTCDMEYCFPCSKKLHEHPERQPGLYNYAKSLERVESSLLGGFYFRHFWPDLLLL